MNFFLTIIRKHFFLNRSPGLVDIGRDSRSEGRGFEYRHCKLDGHFSHTFVVKIVMFVGKDQK